MNQKQLESSTLDLAAGLYVAENIGKLLAKAPVLFPVLFCVFSFWAVYVWLPSRLWRLAKRIVSVSGPAVSCSRSHPD